MGAGDAAAGGGSLGLDIASKLKAGASLLAERAAKQANKSSPCAASGDDNV